MASKKQYDLDMTSDQALDQDTIKIVWLLLAGGAMGSLYLLITKKRSLLSWAIPIGMFVAGMDIFLKYRQENIRQVEKQIVAQLEGLDPIARAQVLEYVAKQQVSKYQSDSD
jgi:hypothetical protein